MNNKLLDLGLLFVRMNKFITNLLRYAVLGTGFAGLSVAWHLLKLSPKKLNLKIDIYDEVELGEVPLEFLGAYFTLIYSPKVKLLWKGAKCWNESLMLLSIAERAPISKESSLELAELGQDFDGFIVRRRGILRLATGMENLNVLYDVIPLTSIDRVYINFELYLYDLSSGMCS